MKEAPSLMMRFAFVSFGALLIGSATVWTVVSSDGLASEGPSEPPHPALFDGHRICSSSQVALQRARRLEQQGQLYAERYPYDPRDGVRAVARFREARSCYQLAGSNGSARRAERRESRLIARLQTDYASARLALKEALDTRRWAVAQGEIRRLLGLTAHLEREGYVDWLESIAGKVAARAR